MPRGLFVTGTDTGVGKTLVSCALLHCAARRGLRPVPYKPVETGCDPEPQDARTLWSAAGQPAPLDLVCPFAVRLPAAPLLAARAEGVTLTEEDLARGAERLSAHGDFLLVEGAGGLLVPYAPEVTAADLAARLQLPVLVVGRSALGTINHTALTVMEIRRRGLTLAGIILSQGTPRPGPQEYGNLELVFAVCGVRPLGTLPYLPDPASAGLDLLADRLTETIGEPAVARLLGG